MRYLFSVFVFMVFSMSGVFASQAFDATSYEVMQNCLAEAESLPNAGDYVEYCIDGYLSTQQLTAND